MEIKIFGKEINIMLQISREGDFVDTFIKLNKSFKLEGFLNICLGAEDNNIGKPAFISEYYADRKNTNYFHVTVMEEDEERFHNFLKKFCEENGISLEISDTKINEDSHKTTFEYDGETIVIGEDITFEYDGKTYVVGGKAYNKNYIKLPDGRLLHVGMWPEYYPPQPAAIQDITALFVSAKRV